MPGVLNYFGYNWLQIGLSDIIWRIFNGLAPLSCFSNNSIARRQTYPPRHGWNYPIYRT
jgi:hypothetical protein